MQKKSKEVTYLLIAAFIIFLSFPKNCLAYIDPGSGSYVVQVIIASLLGATFAIKLYWKKLIKLIKDVFNKKEKKKEL
jgi:hypothetical protein